MELKEKLRLHAAIGLNEIDKLVPTQYFYDLISNDNIFDLDYENIEKLLKEFHNNIVTENLVCDLTSLRMLKLSKMDEFYMSVDFLKFIHEEIFKDLFSFAGEFRTENIWFGEKILNFDTVKYANYYLIEDSLSYDMLLQSKKDLLKMDIVSKIDSLVKFNSNIWQVHPFKNGNTRTTAMFILLYLYHNGVNIDYTAFSQNSYYYRNALVRANYYNDEKKIKPNYEFLTLFYENLLLGKNHLLRSSDLIVGEMWDSNSPDYIGNIRQNKKA